MIFSNEKLRITVRDGIIRNIKNAIENKENIEWKFVSNFVDRYLIQFVEQSFMGNLGRILKKEILKDMSWFESVADLIEDHKKLKESIKSWATRMDIINNVLVDYQQEQIIWWNNSVQSDVEELLHEMMAINI